MSKQKLKQTLYTHKKVEAHLSEMLKALSQFQLNDRLKNPDKKIKRTSQKSIKHIKTEISLLLGFYGVGSVHIDLENQPPLSPVQIALIDMDFDGVYFRPNPKDFSETYQAVRTFHDEVDSTPKYRISDYDFEALPIWEEMKKFSSFRPMRRPIAAQLSKIGYPPEEISSLGIYDIIDLIGHHNREHPEHRLVGQKQRFLKMFEACYGEEFVQKMSLLGREKLAKDFLTYIHHAGHPSKKCPPDAKKAAAFFSVHHGKNRKHANELEDYSQTNDFSRLTLCLSDPYHNILHKPKDIDINPNIIFFGSLLREFQIMRDPAKERLYAQGLLKSSLFQKEK